MFRPFTHTVSLSFHHDHIFLESLEIIIIDVFVAKEVTYIQLTDLFTVTLSTVFINRYIYTVSLKNSAWKKYIKERKSHRQEVCVFKC